jgi:hypothetical protein
MSVLAASSLVSSSNTRRSLCSRCGPLLLAAALVVGCTRGPGAGVREPGADAGPDIPKGADSGTSPTTDRQAFCEGSGPLVLVGDQGGVATERCAGDLAQVTFRFALCSCDPIGTAGRLSTDAFDHTAGPYDPSSAISAGAVGANGALRAVGPLAISGPLQIGSGGAQLMADGRVRGDLRCEGDITHVLELRVDGDAEVDGSLYGSGALQVDGTLTQPAGAGQSSLGGKIGARAVGPVAVLPPCDCAAERLLDVAQMVRNYAQSNDNSAAGFERDALRGVLGDRRLPLPCGRLYLSGIDGGGSVTLQVSGRTALFVGGSINLAGGLRVELGGPAAELDLFVEQGAQVAGGLALGDGKAPSAVRLYVGGDGSLDLASAARIGGNVYAPRAAVHLAAGVEVFGSLFAGSLHTAGDVTVHYDLAVLKAGEDCSPPGAGAQGDGGSTPPKTGCESCRDCGNQACIEGVCGSCRTDADCCAPLRCAAGQCIAPIL